MGDLAALMMITMGLSIVFLPPLLEKFYDWTQK